jgi:hypothetical protein
MSSPDKIPNLVTGYWRRLLEGGQLIESKCVTCGVVITGSAREGLSEREAEHLADCAKSATN